MGNIKKKYKARCYQSPNGRYYSIDEVERYSYMIEAHSEDDAWCQVAELESVDSEIRIQDRWNLFCLSIND